MEKIMARVQQNTEEKETENREMVNEEAVESLKMSLKVK